MDYYRNPKSEIINSKQTQNYKYKTQNRCVLSIWILGFEFV